MNQIKGTLILLITSIIWGSTFVAQSVGMDSIGPFAFNIARYITGLICLTPVVLFIIKRLKRKRKDYKKYVKFSYKAGILSGIFAGLAGNFQQHGMLVASASKAGFLTALYIVFVPIIAYIVFKKKTNSNTVVAVTLAIIGFYLLSVKGDFAIEISDLELIACAFCYSIQIVIIDKYAKDTEPIIFTQAQLIPSLFISIAAFIIFKEKFDIVNLQNAIIPILYAGIMSLSVASCLQVIGQKYSDPTVATIVMSLESVFAAIFGYLFQNDILSTREIIGCITIFLAVILSQIDPNKLIQIKNRHR